MLGKKQKRKDSHEGISKNHQIDKAACRWKNTNEIFSKFFSFNWEDQKLEGIKINPCNIIFKCS